jgi:hypothetical protein
MLHFAGEKFVKVKIYDDHSRSCPGCRSINLQVDVYCQYLHFCYIPFAADNNRKSEIFCKDCGYLISDKQLGQLYEKRTRPPVYFFSGPIIAILTGLFFWLFVFPQEKKMSERLLHSPKTGDLYQLSKGSFLTPGYYYLKISRIKGDSIFLLHNSFEYNKEDSYFAPEDFFVKDNEVAYLKKDLTEMFKESKILRVKREYDNDFNRIK